MTLLEMKHISKAFGGVYANEDISLSVEKGEIHALLGENGAGKTTLMNILYGLYTADDGEIFWKGKKVTFESPKEAIANGIGMVQQHFSLVRRMSVLDNIILNLEGNSFVLDRKRAKNRLMELSEKYGLAVDPDALIYNLSVGEQQRVEILKALYRNVELLILDEPTGVLTPQETEHFFDVLRNLKDEGYGIIIITHRMSEIMAISDRVTILRDGKAAASLKTAKTDPLELSRYMIGRELKEEYRVEAVESESEILILDNVSAENKKTGKKIRNVSLNIRQGEILGIAGVEGNGQKELAEAVAGILKVSGGTITIDGKTITHDKPFERYMNGIAYIAEDRQMDSLIRDMTITENMSLREYKNPPLAKGLRANKKVMKEQTECKMEEYQIRASGRSGSETKVGLLSGGNQQKVIIAREMTDKARIVVACQPTRGLDIGATEFVREKLIEQRNAGKGVLLISADLEEIMAISDRIAVLFGGSIVGVLDRSAADVQKIGLLMGGISEKEA